MAYFKNYKSYHLIAHSFGSFFALKLAEKLESQGKSGTITFIDGAPIYLKMLTAGRYQTDDQLQNDIIDFITAGSMKGVLDLQSVSASLTWDEKIKHVLSFITDQQKYGKDYLRLLLHAVFNRMKIALYTDAKISSLEKTKSILIRPKVAWIPNINEHYDLQVNFKEKVRLSYLDGTHFTILENPMLLDTLNQIHSEIEN